MPTDAREHALEAARHFAMRPDSPHMLPSDESLLADALLAFHRAELQREVNKQYQGIVEAASEPVVERPDRASVRDRQVAANADATAEPCRGSGNRCINNALPNNNGFCDKHTPIDQMFSGSCWTKQQPRSATEASSHLRADDHGSPATARCGKETDRCTTR